MSFGARSPRSVTPTVLEAGDGQALAVVAVGALKKPPTTHRQPVAAAARRELLRQHVALVASSSGESSVYTSSGRPMVPPVMLDVNAPASRTTRMSR